MSETQWYRTKQTWWRHQSEAFSALLAFCVGNSPVTGEFPAQMPVTRSFDIFFDLRLIKRLSNQSRGWWSETLSRSLWRHSNIRGERRSNRVHWNSLHKGLCIWKCATCLWMACHTCFLWNFELVLLKLYHIIQGDVWKTWLWHQHDA